MTAVVVVMIIIIMISKTTALINIQHRSLPCSQLKRQAQLCFYRSCKHWIRLPRAVVWAGFLEDLALAFPTVTASGGLTLPDPGKRQHCSPQDTQVSDILHSSVFITQREESCLCLGKMVFYKINKCAWGGSVATNELGWKSKLDVQTFEQWL